MRSMAIVTKIRYGGVKVTLQYDVPSARIPCVLFHRQLTAHACSGCRRHRVNPSHEGHAPSDRNPFCFHAAYCILELMIENGGFVPDIHSIVVN